MGQTPQLFVCTSSLFRFTSCFDLVSLSLPPSGVEITYSHPSPFFMSERSRRLTFKRPRATHAAIHHAFNGSFQGSFLAVDHMLSFCFVQHKKVFTFIAMFPYRVQVKGPAHRLLLEVAMPSFLCLCPTCAM